MNPAVRLVCGTGRVGVWVVLRADYSRTAHVWQCVVKGCTTEMESVKVKAGGNRNLRVTAFIGVKR